MASDIVKVLIHREFKKHGVDIKSIEQPQYSIYKKDPSDLLIDGLMEFLDQYQRLEIAMKLGRGRNKKAQQGSQTITILGLTLSWYITDDIHDKTPPSVMLRPNTISHLCSDNVDRVYLSTLEMVCKVLDIDIQ